MQLTDSVENLPRITKPQIAALKKLEIQTIGNLLLYLPFRYADFSKLTAIKFLTSSEPVTVQVTVKSIQSRFSFRGGKSIAEALVSDSSGSMRVLWFNQGYLAKTLKKGDELFLSGTPEYYKNNLQLVNPIYEKVSDFPIHTSRLVPIYRLTEKLYPKTFRNLIARALPAADYCPDPIPQGILDRQGIPQLSLAIKYAHFPEDATQAQLAKKRFAFEEIFFNQLLAQKHKLNLLQKQSFSIPFNQQMVKDFLATLPFALTPGQKKATWDILQDIEKRAPMNRLLEGDVGSGKTLVALIAAMEVASAGLQVAFLAPTEILARQHFSTVLKVFRDFYGRKNHETSAGVTSAKNNHGQWEPFLLTNSYSKVSEKDAPKNRLHALIAEGMPGLFVGTHALIQEKVKFKNLALVIIDEQHRFGVQQRASLIRSGNKVPHLLSLSATPIPRTLQLAYYGELDISQIKTKPAGRKPIVTKLVSTSNRDKAYGFLRQQINSGRQVFVITPLIEESETLDVKAAKTEVENLKKIFLEFEIGLMHGKLKGTEKEQVMSDFLAKRSQILVSTSVIEVGVDVPNATVMVIEGAERFGLAQLHQFRGRVGRSDHQSYCFLFTEKDDPKALERLNAFTKTQDGFELAELDLKQRGFGELYGHMQSGWNFKYFSPAYTSLVPLARQEAQQLLQHDPQLENYSGLREKIKSQVIHFE